jgi:hypothetical protein
MAPYNRHFELDAAVFRKSQRALAKALRGGGHLTRQELRDALERAGIVAGGAQRLAHIMMQAELDAVICSGARRRTQFTYALLDERVPEAPPLPRDRALAELTRRYFISHGPAQMADFSWWSGLRIADVRAGLEMVGSELSTERVDGRTYWFSPATPAASRRTASAFLLSLYDEYLIAYKDRSAALDLSRWKTVAARDPFVAPVVLDGRVVGGWKRAHGPHGVAVNISSMQRLDASKRRAVTESARAYADFFGADLTLSTTATRRF